MIRRLSTFRKLLVDMRANIIVVKEGETAPSKVNAFSAKGFSVNGDKIDGLSTMDEKSKNLIDCVIKHGYLLAAEHNSKIKRIGEVCGWGL